MEQQFNPTDLTPQMVQEIKAEQEKHYKLVGSLNIPRGMKLFAFSTESREITEVHRTAIDTVDFTKAQKHEKDVAIKKTKATFDPKAVYIFAINKKNAWKKILRMVTKNT